MQQKTKYMWIKRVAAIAMLVVAFLAVSSFVQVFATKNVTSLLYLVLFVWLALFAWLIRFAVIWARHKEEALEV